MADLDFADLSPTSKWRVFSAGEDMRPGTSRGSGEHLMWSVSPGESTVLGDRPGGESVDLTHVRALFRLTGRRAAELINQVCALDLGEGMFPNGAAARTLFAGVVTELVRDDHEDVPSYLILPSRSYSTYIREVIFDAGTGLGLSS